jgi:hypothetical protein
VSKDVLSASPIAPTAAPHSTVLAVGTILLAVERFLRRYVVLSDDQAVAVVLWIAHTYAIAALVRRREIPRSHSVVGFRGPRCFLKRRYEDDPERT